MVVVLLFRLKLELRSWEKDPVLKGYKVPKGIKCQLRVSSKRCIAEVLAQGVPTALISQSIVVQCRAD